MSLTKRVPVLFSPEEYAKLKEVARKRRKTMGALIREAVGGAIAAEKGSSTDELLGSFGKIKLDIDLEKLREDRDINR